MLSKDSFDEIYEEFILDSNFCEIPEYYRLEKNRYWKTLNYFSEMELPRPADILEIGGGQLAILRQKIFKDNCCIADVSADYRAPVENAGLDFETYNLMDDPPNRLIAKFDAVILLEVIEHIPEPAHVVFERIKPMLRPKGILFVTTPNLFRLRNLIRMLMGREFTDRFTVAEPGKSLGHQLEYSADHLSWQFERAGMEVLMLREDQLGQKGHSSKARFARAILAPLRIRPKWREGLVAAARKSEILIG